MDFLSGILLGFTLVLTRVGAFFSVFPLFGWKVIPVRLKVAMILVAGFFFGSQVNCPVRPEDVFGLQSVLMMINEAIYGLGLGLVCALLFLAVQVSARIVEQEMGLSMANVFDPFSGDQAESLSVLSETVFALLFLAVGGHHVLLQLVQQSFVRYPIGSIPDLERLTKGLIEATNAMLLLGLQMAGPIVAVSLLTLVILAIMSKVAPEANVLFLSFPLRIGMGMFMVGIFFPFLRYFVNEFMTWLDKLLPL
jgi:flagellar biosynthesis protein FliR